jgi:hypothetical protein
VGEGRGASVAVGRRDVADSGTAAALTSGARASSAQSAVKHGMAGPDRLAPAIVPGGDGLNTIQIQTNSNYFKTF